MVHERATILLNYNYLNSLEETVFKRPAVNIFLCVLFNMKDIIFAAVKPSVFRGENVSKVYFGIDDVESQRADKVFWGEV